MTVFSVLLIEFFYAAFFCKENEPLFRFRLLDERFCAICSAREKTGVFRRALLAHLQGSSARGVYNMDLYVRMQIGTVCDSNLTKGAFA